ncbi:cell division protein ZipA C-terminal FtsZ-binding domain-containing protein [Orrella sp. JC864]|uniref:cell division protein ZipA C-terminal FtsZ-binding domain-containing protein n=1 Tax=Orrella sp. JC864 TaxID=3120298 RepID=UPI00300909AC
MSDLQIGLILLGVLLIALVLGFNWWQDRRARQRMQAHFPASEHDPLLGAGTAGGAAAPGQRREPGLGVAHYAEDGAPGAHEPAADDPEEADASSEVVIDLAFPAPVPAAELMAALQSMRHAGRKPVRVFAETDQGRHRARLRPGEHYVSMQIAVLLANRSGPLSAIEWSQAWARAQDLAERFEATIEGPEQQAVLERAAKLDDTCAALDTQVGLTLMLGAARPLAHVLRAAQEIGFVPQGQRLAWLSDEGLARFTLSRADGQPLGEDGQGSVERMSLLLDVPCSPPDPQPFGRMVKVGRELAARLDAELVDDQGRPLQDGAEAGIDERLQVLYTQLEQAGLPAASARALRVFS